MISSSMEASRQQNEQLANDLKASRTQVQALKAEFEQVNNFTQEAHAESIGQLQRDLDAARESQRYAESHYEAGCLSSQRNLEEKKRLQAENRQQAEEESLKTQLA